MLAGKGGAGSQAGAAMATATAGALELKYTREIEADADLNGLHYMIKAGYGALRRGPIFPGGKGKFHLHPKVDPHRSEHL